MKFMLNFQKKEVESIPFKSEISVPGDYDSLNEASEAILHMQNRPEGEAGRVTINLTSDLFEQTVMKASYVTLKGNGHTVSWYYGVGTLYYSVDPVTGLYNEVLARDKYSYAEANANLWGGVFIVKGNNFIAEDTTFKNTYNYELTEAEKTDIAGSTLSVNRLAPNADVTKYAYKERSNAFYIDADNIECYNCKILSSQDTLGRNGSANYNYHTYFNNCVIGGNVDYICGEFSAVFDNCELQWKTYKDDASNNAKVGYITAAKTSPYVFRNCNVTTDGVGTGVVGYYGRTWGASSNSAFIQTQTNGLISAEGWREMSAGDGQTAVFKEYGNLSGETPFVTNGKFCLAANQTAEAVADYIDTDTNSAINTVLNGWKPVHYGNAAKPGDKDDVTKPGKPSEGEGTTPGKPSEGEGTTPGKPSEGEGTTPNKPSEGDGTVTIKPSENTGSKEDTTVTVKPSQNTSNANGKTDAVKTGDSTSTALYALFAFFAMLGCIVLRKKQIRE